MKKTTLQVKSNKENEMDYYDDKIDEMYRPFLIHSTTYLLLTDQVLSLLPFQRNVVLTMNEYDLSDINPMHPKSDDSPTHVIIFCIRFVIGDTFQPIGGLLIYKHKDQSALLAECLKAFINDVWKLGLYVIATISPPVDTFKGILSHIVDIKNFDTYSDVITYSVAPFKDIVHIYDIQFLLMKLQNLFKESDIRFKEGSRELLACWDDISTVINSSPELKILSTYLLQSNASRRVHIFSQQIYDRYIEFEAWGNLSSNAGGCAVLLVCIRSFLQFTELDFVDLSIMYKGNEAWETITDVLRTMTFEESKKRTYSNEIPNNIPTIAKPCARRKIDFDVDDYLDIENLTYNMEDNVLINIQEEYFERTRLEILGIDSICDNPKKGKTKKSVNIGASKNNEKTNMKPSVVTQGSKLKLKKQLKPHENFNNLKIGGIEKSDNTETETSMKGEKTEHANESIENGKLCENPKEICLESKPYYKTDNFYKNVNSNKSGPNKFDNNIDTSCDKDKNNYNEVNLLDDAKKKTDMTAKNNCDNKIRDKQTMKKIEEENFDLVINDADIFFKSFGSNNLYTSTNLWESKLNNSNGSQNFTENGRQTDSKEFQNTSDTSNDINVNVSKCETPNDSQKCSENLNDFCSPSDEETENSISESCDKIPNIIQYLNNGVNREKPPDDFGKNNFANEMLSTVTGMKKLMENLLKRRVRLAKPDAFIVEHIDFLVSMIKRDKNKITSVHYYGHTYCLLNSELAFDTLQNNKGLYLVSK